MEQYLLPKARNTITGQTVKQQDLTGSRFQMHQRDLCQMQANRLSEQMTAKTRQLWTGFVEQYTPSQRRS